MKRLERYFVNVMKGKQSGLFSSILRALLFFFSIPYASFVFLRNWIYDNEWFSQYQPPIPVVISIGNIVTGGTGKTPLVLLLAEEFIDNFKIGILSRGYRSPVEKMSIPLTLSIGGGPLHSAAYAGDEPYLISKNVPKACVYVGKNRQKSVNLAAKASVQLAILDDALQHRQLARDYDIIVADVNFPFQKSYYLPRGFLRESFKAFSRASLVVLNHVLDKNTFEKSKNAVKKYTTASIIGTCFELENIYNLEDDTSICLENKKVALFCGIGEPERFISTVSNLGANIIGEKVYADHAFFNSDEMISLSKRFKEQGAEVLVCTEKDKVKIPQISDLHLPIAWVKMRLKVVENQEEWTAFISQVKADLQKQDS